MKTILVPSTLTKQSEYVIETAAGIASKANAQLIILHVIRLPYNFSFVVSGEYVPDDYEDRVFMLQILKAKNRQLKELSTRKYLQNISVKYELKIAPALKDVSDIVLQYKTDLIVMGTRPHSTREVFLSSTVSEVIRAAKCPIMTLQEKPATVEYKNIVFATSMSDNEEVFARVVKTAQSLFGGTVHLLKVITRSRFLPENIAMEQLEEYALFNHFSNFTTNVISDLTEEEGILHFAENVNADIIAIANHGSSNLIQLFSGSISKEIINQAKSPVLTFRVAH
jgi:nucleotide-binding universal stress UspA family protein